MNKMSDVVRRRLRLHEVIPLGMQQYEIKDGRVWFTASGLFEVAFTLTGPAPHDWWYILDFRFATGSDPSAVPEGSEG